jgi:hypothetical protein
MLDTDPLIRFDAFDCTTFVETVLANGDIKKLNKIRYKNGQIDFINRNHFIEVDWLKNNSDIVENVSNSFPDYKTRTVIIDKQNWFKKIHNIDVDIAAETTNIDYIPYANVGDIIEIEVESKAENISDQGKVFSVYTYPNNSITKPTDASITGLYEEDFSTSTTQDPYVMDWKKHVLRYIATTNGLYVIQYGLKGSQNGTIYLRSFNVNVYKTGLVKNVGIYENKVLLKNFANNVSNPNNCRLHRSVNIFKFLELHFDWDGTTFITQIPCNATNTTTFSTSWVYTTNQAKIFVLGANAIFSISGVISDTLEYNTLVIQNTVKVIDENGISDSGSSSNFKLKRVYGIY